MNAWVGTDRNVYENVRGGGGCGVLPVPCLCCHNLWAQTTQLAVDTDGVHKFSLFTVIIPDVEK